MLRQLIVRLRWSWNDLVLPTHGFLIEAISPWDLLLLIHYPVLILVGRDLLIGFDGSRSKCCEILSSRLRSCELGGRWLGIVHSECSIAAALQLREQLTIIEMPYSAFRFQKFSISLSHFYIVNELWFLIKNVLGFRLFSLAVSVYSMWFFFVIPPFHSRQCSWTWECAS